MIYQVKHVDVQHQRRKAIVTAANTDDCIAQVEAALGKHIGLTVVRLSPVPVLQLCSAPVPAPLARWVRRA